ncbi:hypothetical protein P3S68_033692 [Capsicum galapagoense]
MDCVKLVLFFMLYPFLCQLSFPSSLPHLCPKHQALALLQFRQMFTINSNASDDFCYNPKTLSWNRRTDCCSWNGVYCDKMTGQLQSQTTVFNSGFTGLIPAEISHISRLQFLTISTVDPYGLRLGPYNFQLLLKNMTQLRYLDLEYLNISSTIPERDLTNLTNLEYLRLSYNSLTGPIPSNFPNWSNSIQHKWSQNLQLLYLSSNYLNGTIPSWIFSLPSLVRLDLSNNSFSGKIQEFKSNTLEAVVLDQNQLQGTIPKSLLDQQELYYLTLSQNNFSGQIASTVCNLKRLIMLDLGRNHLNGTISHCLVSWPISDSRTDNLFAKIRVIDLSSNGFSGNLPVSLFENFQAMKINGENSGTQEYVADKYSVSYASTFIVTTKGLDLEFPRVLTTEIIINLSRNRFEGHIPTIIGDLVGLRTLNLSNNGLEGVIPASLHQLSVLESLDLSSNKIDGEIPQQLASLTFLQVLNLSHNHLVGCIAKGKQFDTFENSSYQGNDGLRGFPLSKDCGGDDGVPQPTTPVERDDDEE